MKASQHIRFVFLMLTLTGLCSLLKAQTYSWAKGEGGIGNDASNSIASDNNGNIYITGNIAGAAEFSGSLYQGRGIYDVFIAKYSPEGSLIWVKTAGGNDNDMGNDLAIKNNSLYLTGYFNDTAWFENTMLVSTGESDMFLARYDLNGNLIWVRQGGGPYLDYGQALTIDENENVYVCGYYETNIRFDTTTLSSANIYNESFIAKYSTNGVLMWCKSSSGTNTNLISDIAYDNHQHICFTGYFSGSFSLNNSTLQSNTPSADVVIGKMTTEGALAWIKRAGSSYEDQAQAICCDNEGNPSVTGYFAGTAFFDSHSVTYLDYNDVFIAHYDSDGNNLWVKAGHGNQLDIGFSITTDQYGNIFATGMYENGISFDGHYAPGVMRDVFLVSYSSSGSFRWLDRAGDVDTDCGLDICISSDGYAYITGYYLYNCYFGNLRLDYADYNDIFIAKYSPPVIIGMKELGAEDWEIFPNPVTNKLYIKHTASDGQLLALVLQNNIGQVVMSESIIAESHQTSISLSALPKGCYILTLESENHTFYRTSLIKE